MSAMNLARVLTLLYRVCLDPLRGSHDAFVGYIRGRIVLLWFPSHVAFSDRLPMLPSISIGGRVDKIDLHTLQNRLKSIIWPNDGTPKLGVPVGELIAPPKTAY